MEKFIKTNNLVLISIGAIPAALFRWQIDEIFVVNIIGCFLIGFINTLKISKTYKLIFGIGFCASLTTFSGLSFYLFKLLNQRLYTLFFVNSILMVLFGFFAIFLGYVFAKKINN